MNTPNAHEGPPTTEEVADLINASKRDYLRKAERNIIKRLLTHRNYLVTALSETATELGLMRAHADNLESKVQEIDASLRAAKVEIERLRG